MTSLWIAFPALAAAFPWAAALLWLSLMTNIMSAFIWLLRENRKATTTETDQ